MATGIIGAKIVLEGEAAYRKALRDIKTAQAELRSEMKLCNTQFAGSEKSIDALTKKTQILYKQYEQSAKKVEVYQKAMQTSTEKEKEAAKRVEELTKKLQTANENYAEMGKSSEATAESMKAQEEEISKLEVALKNANSDYDKSVEATKKYQTQLNLAKSEMQGFENELEQTKADLNSAKNATDQVSDSVDDYGKNIKEAENNTVSFGDILKANLTSEAIISGVKAIASAVKEISAACIESGANFEAAMSNVQALSGANEKELAKLTEKAKELGASTIYSATEVADAMSYMSLAGWNTQQTLAGIDSVLSLSAASAMDLARASDIVTDNLTAFGLSAEDAEKFADQLAYTMSHSNTTVELLGESYKNCAATAKSMGYSVEEVTAVLATMANAGVKGGEAGTALNTIMTRLATNAKGCADTLAEYGVAIYDQEGNMNSLSSILQGISNVWAELTDQEQAALAKSIAGTNQYSKLQTIMAGLSDEATEAGMSFTDYAEALQNCDGAAKDMADTMQNNLKGKVTALQSAMEGLQISVYDTFDDSLKKGVDYATVSIQKLNRSVTSGSLNVSLSRMAKSLENFADKAINVGEKALPVLIDAFSWVLDNAGEIAAGIGGVVAAQYTMTTVVPIVQALAASWSAYSLATEGATVAQWALNVAMEANPIGIIVTALVGLTAATVAYYTAISQEKTEAEEAFDVLIKGYDDVVESAKQLADATSTFSTETKNEFNYVNGLVSELQTLTSKEKLSADEKARVSVIAKELNSRYEELNLTIDEQTGKLSKSCSGWEDLINTQLKQAQVSAVEEKLASIYEEQADYQYKIWEMGQKINDNNSRKEEIDKRLLELQALGSDANMQELEEMQALYDEAAMLDEQNKRLAEDQAALTTENEALSGSIGELTEYMEENLGVTVDAAGNMRELGEAAAETNRTMIEMSDQTAEALSGMYDSVSKSISGQMDLFSEWKEQEKIASEELQKNLDDQVNALNAWADNLAVLADRGIDENLYKKLAEMGPEGANYAAAFVAMSDEELSKYGEKFAEALQIEDTVSKELTEQYAELAGYILEGMELGLQDDGSVVAAVGTVSQDVFDKFCEDNGIHSPSEKYREWAEYIPEGMALGVEDGESVVLDAIEMVSKDMIQTAQNRLSQGDFDTIGYNISVGLANGISSGTNEVVKAINSVCDSAISAAQTKLQIHSPSRVFAWMGEMSGEGYINGLQESMSDVGQTISNAMGSVSSVGDVAGDSSNVISQIANMIAEYLPEIAEKDATVNVTAEADADGIFKIVQKKSRQYTKQTGEYAF